MYHVLPHTTKLGKTGVTRGALSAHELAAPDLNLKMDAESLRLVEIASLGSASQSSSMGFSPNSGIPFAEAFIPLTFKLDHSSK